MSEFLGNLRDALQAAELPAASKEQLHAHVQETFDLDPVAANEISDICQSIGISLSQIPDFFRSEYISETETIRAEFDSYEALDRLSKLLKAKPAIPDHLVLLWSNYHHIDENTDKLKTLLRIHQVDHNTDRLLTTTLELIHDHYAPFSDPEKIPTGRNLYEALTPYKHHAEAMNLLRDLPNPYA